MHPPFGRTRWGATLSDAPVFLLDVDDTLLDNDRFGRDLDARLERDFGPGGRARYRAIYEQVRAERGYADYLEALQRFRGDLDDEPAMLALSTFVLDYPFHERLYPGALETVAHLAALGRPVILSDGDIVFQPHKIRRSGLWDAVQGRVLVPVHKQRQVQAIRRLYPASRYVMVDDKPDLLAAMKAQMGDRLTTVFVCQGHYAAESRHSVEARQADLTVECVGDLRDHGASSFATASPSP